MILPKEEMKTRKFGKLRMKDPKEILPGSNKKEIWICDCGRETNTKISYVISGHTVSCGRCNEIPAEEMKTRKFGKLRMKDPKKSTIGSHKRETWICDCGKEKIIITHHVISGRTTSCGNCHDTVQNWYLGNIEKLRSLKCPIQPEDFPFGGPVPLEVIERINSPFKCQCALCGKIYSPRFSDIKLNNGGLTCGCSAYLVSSTQKNISRFIEFLGFFTELEYKVGKLKYDIFVPGKNLLIEYDGTHWHAMKGSKERDQRKEQNALSSGYEFFRITEKEWAKNRKRVENQLKQTLT